MNTQSATQPTQSTKSKEQQTIARVTQMLAQISTDWKLDIANNQILATDTVDLEQAPIATFNSPNHMDVTFAYLAPTAIKTLLDLHGRGIAKVKELQATITKLQDVVQVPNKDYSTQISMMFNEQGFIEFLIARYQLAENPTTKKAITACDKALKKEIGVTTKSDIKWRISWTEHWTYIYREYQMSAFKKQEEAAA